MNALDKLFEGIARILLERNVANDEVIAEFLKRCLQHVGQETFEDSSKKVPLDNRKNIYRWINGNLRNWLRDDYKGVERLSQIRAGMPQWFYKKAGADPDGFLAANEVYWINIDHEIEEQVMHALDFMLTTPPGRDLSGWDVPNTIARGERMNRLKGMDDSELTSMATDDDSDDRRGKYLKPILRFPKTGFFWVEVGPATDNDYPELSKKFYKGLRCGDWTLQSSNPLLRRETALMRHCVGAGTGYGEEVRQGTGRILSLRDRNNQPRVTVHLVGGGRGAPAKTMNQCYSIANSIPTKDLWPYIKDLSNFLGLDMGHWAERFKLIRTANGWIDEGDLHDMSMEEIAKLGLDTKVLRKMGFVTIGGTLMSMKDAQKKTPQELEDSDLTPEELMTIGFIRAKSGKVRSWADMGGEHIPGKTVFEGLRMPIDLAAGITFDNVRFAAYPGEHLPQMNVTGTLEIVGGNVRSLAQGTVVKGELSIKSLNNPIDLLSHIKCGSFTTDARIVRVENFVVGGNNDSAQPNCVITGDGIINIGPGCEFNQGISASKTGLETIDPGTKLAGRCDLSETPLREFMVPTVYGSIDLANTKVSKLANPLAINPKGINEFKSNPALDLYGTPLKVMPPDTTIGGNMTVPKGLKALPDNLRGGTIWIPLGGPNVYPPGAKVNTFLILLKKDTNHVYIYDADYQKTRERGMQGRTYTFKLGDNPVSPGDIIYKGDGKV